LAPALDKPRKLLVRVPRGALQIAQGQPLVGPRQTQVGKPRQHLRNVLIGLVGTHAGHRKSNSGRPRKKRPNLLQRRELCLVHVDHHGSDDRYLHTAADLLLLAIHARG